MLIGCRVLPNSGGEFLPGTLRLVGSHLSAISTTMPRRQPRRPAGGGDESVKRQVFQQVDRDMLAGLEDLAPERRAASLPDAQLGTFCGEKSKGAKNCVSCSS
jgi:hypothetical protein